MKVVHLTSSSAFEYPYESSLVEWDVCNFRGIIEHSMDHNDYMPFARPMAKFQVLALILSQRQPQVPLNHRGMSSAREWRLTVEK